MKYSNAIGGVAPELIAALKDYWYFAYQMAEVPAYVAAHSASYPRSMGQDALPALDGICEFRCSFAASAARGMGPLAVWGRARRRLHKPFHRPFLLRLCRVHLERCICLTGRFSQLRKLRVQAHLRRTKRLKDGP